MLRINTLQARRFAKWGGLGSLAVCLVTAGSFQLDLGFAGASLCYLLLIVLLSLAGDFAASAAVALLSVGCLDYFFAVPIFSFRIARPVDVLALISLLLTAFVITRLVEKVRDRTAISRQHHQKTKELYELAQQLLALEPEGMSGVNFLQPFCGAFGISAVCLFDATTSELHVAGDLREELKEKTRQAYYRQWNRDEHDCKMSVRCIRVGERTRGAIAFDGLEDPALTAGPLTALGAALLVRLHAFRDASQAVAAVQTESYRSLILDALAHEFKTPLATILAAAGALREAGSLGPEHLEMAETVESEAARLGRLTTRLIRTARLEREEVRPWMEVIDVSAVIDEALEQYSRSSPRRRISVSKQDCSTEVLADPELLRFALSQLMDNACKYSPPDSPVNLSIARQNGQLEIRVLSRGAPIPAVERSRIFDRFYRGAEGRRMAHGTGLGLYVARKIALAHGGSLELDGSQTVHDGAIFRLSIPVAEGEGDHVAAAG